MLLRRFPQRDRFTKDSHRFNIHSTGARIDAATLREALWQAEALLAAARQTANDLLDEGPNVAHLVALHRHYRNIHQVH